MNIEQLEEILEHVKTLEDIAKDSHLGMEQVRKDLESLRSTVEDRLKLLVYEKYKEEKG